MYLYKNYIFVAKVKVINPNLDSNLNGGAFQDIPSETIFSFGNFSVTSNFDGKKYIDYTNKLSTFVQPITLETLNVTDTQSEILHQQSINVTLNLDKSDLKTFVRFGSAYEYLKSSIQNIIVNYPGSIFVDSQYDRGGNITFIDFTYNSLTNKSKFKIPMTYVVNKFGIILNQGNTTEPDNIELKNLNISYNKYIIWTNLRSTDNTHTVLGYTGFTTGNDYLTIETLGNPFPMINGTTGDIEFHIKPNNLIFEEFRSVLTNYEQYIISERENSNGFKFNLREPVLLEDGSITYSNKTLLWPTSDDYNIDIDSTSYRLFLEILLTIGAKYDTIKTNLISRFLTPSSIKNYDSTDNKKIDSLLKIYGYEFDQIRQFIDSLSYINKVTYDKINNVPDQLIKNMANTFGWDYFSLVNEKELVNSFLTIDENERNLNTDLMPTEIDIELWRRILINTNYFWKSKGTREVIKSMFLLIGIPEPFINITEYVYTIDNKLDVRTVDLVPAYFPSNTLPFDNDGYPKVPPETTNFYFQISGDSDNGQTYMNVFRDAGFDLRRIVDNKKTWIQTGSTIRIDSSTPQYYQEDSKLVLNTKEVDITLDTAQGIEYDVYNYIKEQDFPANSSGYTLPFSYINISLGYTGSEDTFTLPFTPEGDFEVRYNGILLNPPKTGTTTGITYQSDYTVSGNQFTLNYPANYNSVNNRDIVQVTYLYSGGTTQPISGVTIQYMVTRVKPNITGTIITLPSTPNGDVQLTINGIALTKGTNQFNADYTIDPNNNNQIIIQNPEIISYLVDNQIIQVAYITVTGNSSIAARNEIYRIDSFTGSKLYYSNSANKYVYKLNYKINNAREIKVLINGIALEPLTDYNINTYNQYEIFLPNGLKYGSVISVYYLIGGNDYFDPIINNDFGVGDISQLSFLEFIELIQRKLINVTNRKTITNYKGGWYPTLLNVYIKYLERSNLPSSNPLLSNGYTFSNLYQFLSKYNGFFQKFVDQLLSSTIILRKRGLLIRNTVFTKQKFTYKRGVNFDSTINYLGNDGSLFLKRPLSKIINWSNDYVCVNDLCKNLVVSNINISYPTTTTTTTAFPYESILILNNILSQEYISTPNNSGYYRKNEISFTFNPQILSGYNVNLNINLIITLTGVTTVYDTHQAIISFNKNGNWIYNNTITNDGSIIINQIVQLTNGDSFYIVLENYALTAGVNLILSQTTMTPTVISVTPNGGEFTITPPNIINIINSSGT